MHKSLILLALSLPLFCQPVATTLVGPIYSAYGPTLYTGVITIRAQVKTSNGYAITGITQQVSVVNGRLAIKLVPNDTAVPANTSYAITFDNNDQWTCIVPTSGSPVTWTVACTPLAAAPSPTTPIAVSQLIPSMVNGACLQTFNTSAQWVNCAAGTTTFTNLGAAGAGQSIWVSDAAPGSIPCTGGGNGAWAFSSSTGVGTYRWVCPN